MATWRSISDGNLLAPFRTWRNTITGQAAEKLTDLFQFNVPQRWSVAHLYQAILNKEPHVKNIHHLTTLAGYVHWQLTGQKVLGIGEASGMFPIDSKTDDYDARMIELFNERLKAEKISWTLQDILPKALMVGYDAGILTADGAKRLDPTGQSLAGTKLCPPEGDAGTGMVATNSVSSRRSRTWPSPERITSGFQGQIEALQAKLDLVRSSETTRRLEHEPERKGTTV